MAFDGITLKKIVSEMQGLVGGKVNYIYEPDTNNILIGIYNGANLAINIDTTANNYRIHLTTKSKPNPLVAPNFCMILRKYLINSKITKIYTNGLERICFIDFECFNEMNDKVKRTLAIELMGKYSNILLLNDNNIIIDALKKFDGEDKSIMPTRAYIAPVSEKQEIENLSEKEFIELINKSDNKTLDSAIPSVINGISKTFIKSNIEELKMSNTISENNLKELYKYTKEILKNNCQNAKLTTYKEGYTAILKDETKTDEITKENIGQTKYKSNFFLDDYYYEKQSEEEYKNYRNSLLKILSATLDKITRKLENINEKVESCKNMEEYKISGELLISNIYKFTDSYEKAKKENLILITEQTKYIELENYYDNNKIIKIAINPSLSISKNADKYFKKYNKAKNTLEITKAQKAEGAKELNYIESLVYELDNCKTIEEIDEVYNEISENILFTDLKLKNKNEKQNKKTESMLDNYMKIKIDKFDVFVGKNNKQNDYLTMKVANDNDYWFHTKDIHGSHLILRCNGKMPKISTITKCAELAAYYSKAKFSSHVPVDYTQAKYVKKPKGSAPGYVIYTNNKTIYVNPSSGIQ